MRGSPYEAFRRMLRAQRIGPATWGRAYGLPEGMARDIWNARGPVPGVVLAAIEEWQGHRMGEDPGATRGRLLRQIGDSGLTLSDWAARHRVKKAQLIRWLDGQETIPDIWRNRG